MNSRSSSTPVDCLIITHWGKGCRIFMPHIALPPRILSRPATEVFQWWWPHLLSEVTTSESSSWSISPKASDGRTTSSVPILRSWWLRCCTRVETPWTLYCLSHSSHSASHSRNRRFQPQSGSGQWPLSVERASYITRLGQRPRSHLTFIGERGGGKRRLCDANLNSTCSL